MENMALTMCDTPAALNFKAMMCGWDKGVSNYNACIQVSYAN
jgi:hypothetical protein